MANTVKKFKTYKDFRSQNYETVNKAVKKQVDKIYAPIKRKTNIKLIL